MNPLSLFILNEYKKNLLVMLYKMWVTETSKGAMCNCIGEEMTIMKL